MSDIARRATKDLKRRGFLATLLVGGAYYDPDSEVESVIAAALSENTAALQAERDKALSFIAVRGYRHCDIAACNCGSWHGGHASQRLREISDVLADAGCEPLRKTALVAVCELAQERDELKASEAALTAKCEALTARVAELEAAKRTIQDRQDADIAALKVQLRELWAMIERRPIAAPPADREEMQ